MDETLGQAAARWNVAASLRAQLTAAQRERDAARAECEAQARLVGSGTETILALRAQWEEAQKEQQRLRELIEATGKHWLTVEGVPWEGAIDEAMRAAVGAIADLRAQVTAAQGATVDEANHHAETFRQWHGAQAKLAAIRAVVEPIAGDLVPARHLAARILALTTGPGEGSDGK